MNARTKRAMLGILLANAVALALMLGATMLLKLISGSRLTALQRGDPTTYFILSDFVLIPIYMGAVTAFIWAPLQLSRKEQVGYSILNLLVAIALCLTVLHEGTICILMALPLVILFLCMGYAIGKAIVSRQNRPLQLSFVPLLLIAMVADVMTSRGYEGHVVDTITIRAPARDVWRYIADYPAIETRPGYWLWRIGLPAPIQSTVTGHLVGAVRRCAFTGGIAFDERITELQPEHVLTFDVTSQPNHPEIVGHLVLRRGQFVLHDNGDGTATVTGTSWYTLNVHPAFYYDLWTRDIVRHVHLRVMEHIKALAEAPAESN